MKLTADGVTTYQDMTVNGVRVGQGGGDIDTNTAVGYAALAVNTTANYNVGVGYAALGANLSGAGNTGLGFQALLANSTASNNTAVGVNAGSLLTTGSNNTCIGNNAQPSSDGVSNEVTIGNDDVETTRLKGRVEFSSYPDKGKSAEAPNMYISATGLVYESTTAFYSTEEVDKMLAIKDKLIEKLSARLDSLELKFKALK